MALFVIQLVILTTTCINYIEYEVELFSTKGRPTTVHMGIGGGGGEGR